MEKVLSPTRAICNGKETILLGTYNYMGMTFDPDVIAAGKQALDEFGSGTTGSRVLNGTYQGHKAVRGGAEGLLRHGSCHGLLDRLPGQSRHHLDDRRQGAIISSSTSTATPRSMTAARWAMPRSSPSATTTSRALEKRLARIPEGAGKLVVLEGVYSMLGDVAPLKEMVAVSKAAGAMVLVDEAHSMGFIGPNGRGVAEEQGVLDDVDFVIGTFSKSVGTVGGFCVSNHPKFEILRLVCRPYVFTASLPPSVVATAATSIRKLMHGNNKRAHLWENSQAPPRGPQGARLPARHRGAAIGDHRGDHARPREGRRDVGGAARRRPLRQPRPPARDARQHDPAALLALRRA